MCLIASFANGGLVHGKKKTTPSRIKPHNFIHGAKVKKHHKNIPASLVKTGDTDMVLARVQAGELVIPRKHVKKVESFLKSKKIKLPGM
jgi:hypothetical protein